MYEPAKKTTRQDLLEQLDAATANLKSAIEDLEQTIADEWQAVEEAQDEYNDAVAKARAAGAEEERILEDVYLEKPEVRFAQESAEDDDEDEEDEWDLRREGE